MLQTPSMRLRSRSDDDRTQWILIGLAAGIGIALMVSAVWLPGM